MIVSELFARLGVKVDSSSFAKANSLMGGLKIGMLGLAAVGAGVAYALKSVVEGTADQAREIQRTARITGMGTDALQGLNYAAKQSGVSAEELQHGLVHLARSAQEANIHGGAAGIAYSNLGIRVADASGKLRPLNNIFGEVAQKLSKMPDGTQKAAMALSLFGRGGYQLIPLLDQGPAGLAAFTEEAKKLGIVMDEKSLAAANRYKMTLDRLDGAIQGLKNSISLRLLPAFSQATEGFIRWISAHRQWIALGIAKAFRDVSQVLGALVNIAKGAIDIMERIWKSSALGKATLMGLGIVVASLTAPWLAFMAVLALVAEDIYGYFHGKDSITGRLLYAFDLLKARLGIKDLWDHPIENWKKIFGAFFDWIVATAAELPDLIAAAIGQKKLRQWMDFVLKDIPFLPDLTDKLLPEGSQAQKDFDRWNQPGIDAFKGIPGSRYSQLQQQAAQYLPSPNNNPGNGPIEFHIDKIEVHASDAAGGRAAGKAAGDAIVKHSDLKRMLREARTAVNKHNTQ